MVERIIAPEWTSTGPDGRASDRVRVLAQVFETGVHKIHNLQIDDVNARVFGDTAVVTGRTHGVGEFEGAGHDVVIRFTDVFVRREGRWQAIADYIRGVLSIDTDRPPKRLRSHREVLKEFDAMLQYTVDTLDGQWELADDGIQSMIIQSRWGVRYDLEQLLEHAIVHVLRHRRQIERLNNVIG